METYGLTAEQAGTVARTSCGCSRTEEVVDGLRPLFDLPVEHVLTAHCGPFDRAALKRALLRNDQMFSVEV